MNDEKARIELTVSGLIGVLGLLALPGSVRSLALQPTLLWRLGAALSPLILISYPVVVWASIRAVSGTLKYIRPVIAFAVALAAVCFALGSVVALRAPSKYADGTFPFIMSVGALVFAALVSGLVVIVEGVHLARSRTA